MVPSDSLRALPARSRLSQLYEFINSWFGYDTIDEHTTVLGALLMITHGLSLMIISTEPLSCGDHFHNFSVLEIIAVVFYLVILLVLNCTSTIAEYNGFLKSVHYLYLVGLVWIFIVAAPWFICVKAIPIGSSYKLPFAQPTLNMCVDQVANCYNIYLFVHVVFLVASTVVGSTNTVRNLLLLRMRIKDDARFGNRRGNRMLRSFSEPSFYSLETLRRSPHSMDSAGEERSGTPGPDERSSPGTGSSSSPVLGQQDIVVHVRNESTPKARPKLWDSPNARRRMISFHRRMDPDSPEF